MQIVEFRGLILSIRNLKPTDVQKEGKFTFFDLTLVKAWPEPILPLKKGMFQSDGRPCMSMNGMVVRIALVRLH